MELKIIATYNGNEMTLIIPDCKKKLVWSYVQDFHRKLDDLLK